MAANELVEWQPNGYKSYEKAVEHGGVTHVWSWEKKGYPGNWYIFGNSAIFDRESHPDGDTFFFRNPVGLGTNPAGSGWCPPVGCA